MAVDGIAAGRRAVQAVPLSAELLSVERKLTGNCRWVVRSSTNLDDDDRFSGAFSSFGDVLASEAALAVRGCWASVFNPSVLERLRRSGMEATDVRMGVLIQQQVDPRWSGLARASGTTALVTYVDGHLGRLLSGERRANTAIVEANGSLRFEILDSHVGESLRVSLREVADLVFDAASRWSVTSLEWAVDDRLKVLQLSGGNGTDPPRSLEVPVGFAARPFRRLVEWTVGRRGPLSGELLLPWALTVDPDGVFSAQDADRSPSDAARQFDQALGTAAILNRQVARAARRSLRSVTRALLDGDSELVHRLTGTDGDTRAAGHVMAGIAAAGSALVDAGKLSDAREIWTQTAAWVRRALLDPGVIDPDEPPRIDPWDFARYAVVAQQGSRLTGSAASPGWAVGTLTTMVDADSARRIERGSIVVTEQPGVELAPLLWQCQGMVAMGGSPAAHLCGVARELRVPMVVALHGDRLRPGAAAALDGAAGTFWVLD